MNAVAIVDRLLEADPDDMSPEALRGYLTTDYSPAYRRGTVDLGGNLWSDGNRLGRAFAWLTRIGAAPKFGSVPIHYYQQDQAKAIDAIEAAAANAGMPMGWARFRSGIIQMFHAGKWVPVARVDRGAIVPL